MHKNNCLNTYTDKLHKFYTDNKLFALSIILQIIVLAIMTFIGIFMPANDLEMPLMSLKIYGNDKTISEISENKIMLSKTEDGEDTWIGGGEYNLPFGAYKLEIEYQSEYGAFLNESDIIASVGIYGTNRVEEVYRVSGLGKNTGCLFWVDTIREKSPVSFEIIYKNNNNMQINSVAIRENIFFRYVCIMAVAAAFVIIDIICSNFIAGKSNKKFLNATIILVITLIAVIPLLNDEMYVKHDILFHLNRIWALAEGISGGNFPVRMMTNLVDGYSYPISIFYCDVFLYIPALLCCAGLALQTAYKIYILSITLFTAIISYKTFNVLVRDERISLLGSAMYTLCGYRLLNVYVRGALGEYTAMVFFPLVVWGMYCIYKKEIITYKDWLPLALGMSGIIMSHILSTEIVVIFLVIFCLITLRKTFSPNRIIAFVKAVVVTVLMCMWFIVPFFEYYITHDIAVDSRFPMIQETGIEVKDMLNIFMEGGLFENYAQSNEISFSLGFALLIGIAATTYMLFKNKKWKLKGTTEYITVIKFAVISVMALAFTHCKFPWNFIQTVSGKTIGGFLGNIQFSWRYLSVASITIVALTVISLAVIKKHNPAMEKIISVLIAVAMSISVGYYYLDLEQKDSKWDICFYSVPKEYTGYLGYFEYLLEGSDGSEATYHTDKVIKGNVQVHELYRELDEKYIVCTNNDNDISVVEMPVYNYKYYKASDIDTGEIIKITNGSANRIALNIPAKYSGTIKIEFCPPVHWHIAEAVSAVTVATIIVWYVADSKRKAEEL